MALLQIIYANILISVVQLGITPTTRRQLFQDLSNTTSWCSSGGQRYIWTESTKITRMEVCVIADNTVHYQRTYI